MSCNYGGSGTILSFPYGMKIEDYEDIRFIGFDRASEPPVKIKIKKADPFWAKQGRNKKGGRSKY